jgi:diguanylate cyclase (GGDEF)-like protein
LKPLLFKGSGEVELPRVIEDERSAFLVPMVAGNEEVGVFYVGAAEPCSYDGRACLRLSIVASQCAMAIRNAEIRENVLDYSIIDGVTGLYTHQFFQKRLIEVCREYESSLKPFSLVMIDLDHFIRYNDTLGHPEGDKVLRESAALVRSYTRDSDAVCRYGGDEFVIILKDSDKENSVRTAERIREAFQYRFHTYPVKITVSIGVASYPEDAVSRIDLVTAADAALYRSKKGGRNQVNCAPSLRRGDDPSQSGGEESKGPPGPPGPPGSPSPSNVPVSRRPPGISFGNVREIPDEPGTMSAGDSEDV